MTAFASALIPCFLVAFAAANGATNFLVLFVDDMGLNQIDVPHPPNVYGYTGDNHTISTPNLARFTSEGMLFQHWYSSFHYCSPSRGSMLTGRLPVRLGIGIPPCDYAPSAYPPPQPRMCNGVFTSCAVGGLPHNETTTAEALKTAGYATGIVGKWHLGQRETYLPPQHGFDEYLGVPFSQDMGSSFWKTGWKTKDNVIFQPSPLPLVNNSDILEQPVALDKLVQRYVDFAVSFIKRHQAAGTPWYLYVPFNHIHTPNSCSPGWCGKSKRGPVGDAVEEMDWAVGQIMAAVKEAGADDNTITFFTSDNGAPLGNDVSGNLPLRGGKAQVWEGGFREPGIVRWPGRVAAGSVSEAIVSTMDIHPTIIALANLSLPTDRIIDGINLAPILFAPERIVNQSSSDRAFSDKTLGHSCYYMYRAAAAVNARGELFAVRCGDHKAYWNTNGVAPPHPYKPGLQDPPLLFNLVADPAENSPLASSGDEYKAALAMITAARNTHLDTITPVPDQNGRGSNFSFALCSAPDSQKTHPHYPRCSLNPENWLPQDICTNKACRHANPSFKKACIGPKMG